MKYILIAMMVSAFALGGCANQATTSSIVDIGKKVATGAKNVATNTLKASVVVMNFTCDQSTYFNIGLGYLAVQQGSKYKSVKLICVPNDKLPGS